MSDRPHKPGFPAEPLAREMHDSLAVTFGTGASYALGSIRLEKVGFANIPMLTVTVTVKTRELSSVIPIARQAAFSWLGERGVSSDHLKFTPGVQTGRRRKFTDQHGANRMGETHDIRFDLSAMLTDAVEWDMSRGHLPTLHSQS